jgi:outer membrane lipoprotein LolB
MQRIAMILFCVALLPACVTTRPVSAPKSWEQRVSQLQRAGGWHLDGRAAVAIGTQGWQAALNWRQAGMFAEVHLSGPFGMGALTLKQGPNGLSLNGAPPSDAVMAQVEERLGFEPPLDNLRFWLLGVPDPSAAFELVSNTQDRAQQLTQDGWSIVYDRYMAVDGDVLPAHLVLSRADVRVRIVIDHWSSPR